MEALLARVRALVAAHAAPLGDGEALGLDSFTLVAVAQDLEDAFGITVRPGDLAPESFGSVAAIAAYVARRQAP